MNGPSHAEETKSVSIPITPGEAFDRLTILGIKFERVDDERKPQVLEESARLAELAFRAFPVLTPEVQGFIEQLRAVNGALWNIEDKIRSLDARVFPFMPDCEIELSADEVENYQNDVQEYVSLARGVYNNNDKRSHLKNEINRCFGVTGEVKQYTRYKIEQTD